MLNLIVNLDSKKNLIEDLSFLYPYEKMFDFFTTLLNHQIILIQEKNHFWVEHLFPQSTLILLSETSILKPLKPNCFVLPTLDIAIPFAKQLNSNQIFVFGNKDLIFNVLQRSEFEYLYLNQFQWTMENCTETLHLPLDRFDCIELIHIDLFLDSHIYKGNFYNPHDSEYFKFVKTILKEGHSKLDRTGTGTLSIFGYQMQFDISESVPILTSKYIPFSSCVSELLWFLKGQTDVTILQRQNIHIWDGHSSKDFLQDRGLSHLPIGDIGASYGFQWRHFGAIYKTCQHSYDNEGFDQIDYIIKELKSNPHSRRIFMSSWNPPYLDQMALLPCHVSVQFNVTEGIYLSCHLYQRSMDVFLGAPWNILSYSLFTYYLCSICDLKPAKLYISIGDAHIYNDHLLTIQTQLHTLPYVAPTLRPLPKISIEDLDRKDFVLHNYQSNPKLFGKMSI